MKVLFFKPVHRWVSGLGVGMLGVLSACSYTNGFEAPTPCDLPQTVSYKQNVLPILTQNCFQCHSAKSYQTLAQGTLNMEDLSRIQYYANPNNGQGGVSYVVGNIRHDAGFVPMPFGGGKLDECQIATIKAWVDAGALNN